MGNLDNERKIKQMTDYIRNPHDNKYPDWMASPDELEKRIDSLPIGFDRDPKYNPNLKSGNSK